MRGSLSLALGIGIFASPPADAAEVRGRITPPPAASGPSAVIGYTQTLVAAPHPSLSEKRQDLALFLEVKGGNSLPIPEPTQTQTLTIEGLRFVPDIVSCPLDGKVVLANTSDRKLTVQVEGSAGVAIEPGGSRVYECAVGNPSRSVRVAEWPHMFAAVRVGEVGVAAALKPDGSFAIPAPAGEFVLRVYSQRGELLARDVKVEQSNVDLGALDLKGKGGE